jgi:hypothetical protein
VPERAGDGDRLVAWRRWQRRHGLPDQVFVKVEKSGAEDGGRGGWSKPRYVDFTSALSLSLLPGAGGPGAGPADDEERSGRRVVFEEALPTEHRLQVVSTAGCHVAEMLLDVVSGSSPRSRQSSRFITLKTSR